MGLQIDTDTGTSIARQDQGPRREFVQNGRLCSDTAILYIRTQVQWELEQFQCPARIVVVFVFEWRRRNVKVNVSTVDARFHNVAQRESQSRGGKPWRLFDATVHFQPFQQSSWGGIRHCLSSVVEGVTVNRYA